LTAKGKKKRKGKREQTRGGCHSQNHQGTRKKGRKSDKRSPTGGKTRATMGGNTKGGETHGARTENLMNRRGEKKKGEVYYWEATGESSDFTPFRRGKKRFVKGDGDPIVRKRRYDFKKRKREKMRRKKPLPARPSSG